MPQKILGLDIGSWSVKAVLIESNFRNTEIRDIVEVKIPNGTDESLQERQKSALQQLLGENNLRADFCVGAASGEQASFRFIRLPFSDARKVDAILPGELADLVPFDLDEDVAWTHALLEKHPDGGSTSIAVIAPKKHVASCLERFHQVDLDPRYLGVDVVELHQIYAQFLRDDFSEVSVPSDFTEHQTTQINPAAEDPTAPLVRQTTDVRLIVDIGHSRTLVLACHKDTIRFARVLRAGGKAVTEAIQQHYGLDAQSAEDGKHADAWVSSSRHPAPTDAAQRMSDIVAEGLQDLVRELRRTLQAIKADQNNNITRVDLIGGGAKIRNLAAYLSQQLHVPVAEGVAVEQILGRYTADKSRAQAFALAYALALKGAGRAELPKLDLRTAEFQFSGQLKNLQAKLPIMAASAALLLLLFAVELFVRSRASNIYDGALNRQFCQITQKMIGREICEPTMALAALREPSGELGAFRLPERSAAQVAADISHAISKETDVHVEALQINPEKVQIKGTTDSYDAVEQMVTAMSQNKCFTEIKKTNLHKKATGEGVEFELAIRLGCSE